jgi:hypothetical protein
LLVEEQRTNLLLNSSILGTQVVTVAAVAHTLSFYGTGTVVLSGAFAGTVVGTGAYPARTTLTFTPIVGVLTVTVTGSVTSGQLEAGAFPTSYIPTTTAAATRAADVAVMTGANFSNWYNQNEGTVYVSSARPLLIPSGSFSNLWSISDNTASERYLAYNTGTTQAMDVAVTDGGVAQATLLTTGAISANSAINLAVAYKANDFAATRNGAAPATDTSGTLPTVDRMYIGANHNGAGQWNGWVSRVSYFPRRLSNSELQGITA